MNRNLATKVSNFLLGNGFYIALTLCVGLIGLSGYYLMSAVNTNEIAPASSSTQLEMPNNSQQVSQTPQSPVPQVPTLDASTEKESLEIPTDFVLGETLLEDSKDTVEDLLDSTIVDDLEKSGDTNTENESTDLTDSSQESLGIEALEESVTKQFFLPVVGALYQEHSVEVLSYHPTFGDWRTHIGIDVVTEDHAPVCAVNDGYVSAIFSDEMDGTTVVIVHGESLEATYSNLAEEVSIEVGDSVLAGQLIGKVSNVPVNGEDIPTHLHFSMTENGKAVDPMDYLPEF